MKETTDFGFKHAEGNADAKTQARRRTARKTGKSKKVGSISSKKAQARTLKKLRGASGIREAAEARALLEKQLHSLYWWVFNACKMKAFIRAKGVHEVAERELSAKRDTAPEQADVAADDGSQPGKRNESVDRA